MTKQNTIKKGKPDYKGFVEEFDERVARGFPIDRTTMIEMAEKHNTPVPKKYRR